jgi:DNA gyrase/topoisomerase IV subunit B
MTRLMEQAKNGHALQRRPGLGEIDPEQLRDPTIRPAARRLIPVRIEDALAVANRDGRRRSHMARGGDAPVAAVRAKFHAGRRSDMMVRDTRAPLPTAAARRPQRAGAGAAADPRRW